MTAYRRKLIEVAIPLDAINKASAREKSIRHGHPSTLHLWWARRPLAACRAVLFAQLVDDPSSHPDKFPTKEAVETERKRLFRIIKRLVIWKNSTDEEVLECARVEIRKSCGEELPPVYDPFSGGCSIPLEAQRLGLPAYGSDLNPVAVMIGKAMIEIPPRFKDRGPVHPGAKQRTYYHNAEGLAEDVKYYGEWMRERAFERIGHLYPQVDLPRDHGGGKATVIAWIWARTVPSPDPAFADVHVPLVRSFSLSTKKGKEVWVEPVIEGKCYRFEIRSKANGDTRRGLEGTVGRRGGICIVSRAAMPLNYIREQGRAGNMSRRLMAIVVEGHRRRIYLPPNDEHERLEKLEKARHKPEMKLSGKTRVNVSNYGFDCFGDLFSDRQLVALNPDYSWDMLIRASNPAFSCGRSPVSLEPLSIRLNRLKNRTIEPVINRLPARGTVVRRQVDFPVRNPHRFGPFHGPDSSSVHYPGAQDTRASLCHNRFQSVAP